MGYINKEYLKVQLDNFSNRITSVFARKTDIPTKTSQLENDSGFTTDESSGSVDVLDTMEEIEANTTAGKAAGALAVKELNGSLTNENGEQFRYAYQDGQRGLWVKEADTDVFVPFNSSFEVSDERVITGSITVHKNSVNTVQLAVEPKLIMVDYNLNYSGSAFWINGFITGAFKKNISSYNKETKILTVGNYVANDTREMKYTVYY